MTTTPAPDPVGLGMLPDEDVTALVDVPTGDLARLRARLVDQAVTDGLLDVVYDVVATPVGDLLLAATPVGLVRVAFDVEGHDGVLARLADRVGPRVLRDPPRLASVARQVHEYLAGERTAFELPLDLRLTTGFRRAVLERLRSVGYGRTVSYAALAADAGSPRAVRAVGSACATNPLPVVVPCHRVLRSDGSLGGYVGGLPAKRRLLDLERGAA